MFCPQCGSEVPDSSKSCNRCGAEINLSEAEVPPKPERSFQDAAMPHPPPPPPAEGASGLAIGALICGILSICLCGCLSGIPAIIMGKMELNKINAGTSSAAGKGLASAGFIIGIIGTVLSVLGTLAYIVVVLLAGAAGGFHY